MYPDWPKSAADLVPLPRCDGPKLKSFMFHGSQRIEFLEYIGEGSHAHVFKVRIEGKLYALKLFRFVYDDDWRSPTCYTEDVDVMQTFANYAEPFYCECRAYGRLQEAGYEELATRCFGYLLLDEEHERTMMNQFSYLRLDFNGNMDSSGVENLRSRFVGKDGKDPPIRGIVKEFGQRDEALTTTLAKKLLRDIKEFQQLGIINIDVAHRQVISRKFSDFSTAITVPHFLTSPGLNPYLNPDQKSAMEFETFMLSSNDYWTFDDMVQDWNEEKDRNITVYAFPGGNGCQTKYNLRSKSPGHFYTMVDPRKTGEGTLKKRGRPRWYYHCDEERAALLNYKSNISTYNGWELKDGYIFPRSRAY